MTYTEYVVQEFRKNFAGRKRIAIYGCGEVSQSVLKSCIEYDILCMFDSKTEYEFMKFGKKVLSYKRIADVKPDLIVVLARKRSTEEIYRLIQEQCRQEGIFLYDFQGNDLFGYYDPETVCQRNNQYCLLTKETLLEQINKYEVISFDVFDTLIMRKVPKPDDIFKVMEEKMRRRGICVKDFVYIRKEAERHNKISNPNIYEIYKDNRLLETGCSDEILRIELETEAEMLVRRESMSDILKCAKDIGKRVYLLSDMYLPHDLLQNLLDQLDIAEYQKLYVSCDFREKKSERLYEIFKSEVYGKSYLHIGDNEDVDGICAKANGLHSFIIKSGLEMYRMLNGISDSELDICKGSFIAEEYNDPFALACLG